MAGREYASVVIVALLVVASGSATYAGGQSLATADTTRTGETVVDELITEFAAGDAADDVYVDESGDAVFRYETDHETAAAAAVPLEGELGMEAGTGLVHALYAGDLRSPTLRGLNATGNATTWATADSVTSTGDLLAETPADVDALSVDARRTRTADDASSSLDLAATVTNDTQLYDSIETEGTVETTATTLSTSGRLRTSVPDGVDDGTIALDERRNLTVTETDGTIVLEASERRSVGQWERDRWNTEADARTSLETRYDELAIPLGGDASPTLDDYSFADEGDREIVELSYTVAFTDVKDGLADRITEHLQTASGVDLDEHEARVIADRIATASIDEASVNVVQRGLETDLEWDVALRGTDALVLGIAEIAGSNDRIADTWADRYDEIEADLEARNAAGLSTRTAWSATLDHDHRTGRTTVAATAESNAENWRAYGAEREDRGLGPIRATSATVTADRVGDGIEAHYEYTTGSRETGAATFEQLLRIADGDLGPTIDVAVAAVFDAAFEVARVDVGVDDGIVRIESGASLDEAATFERLLGTAGVTGIYTETTADGTSVYVTTETVFGTEPTDGEIRDHSRVGPTTSVYGPGEWDREFPAVDSDRVRAFLEVEATDDPRADATGVPSGSTLAGGVVLVALVASSLFWFPWRRLVGRSDRPS